MASFSFSVCFSLFFFFVDDDDDDDFVDDDDDDLAVAVVVVVVAVAIVSMFAVEVFVGFVMVDSLIGVFFFFPTLTPWVQPSLSGLSPVFALGVSFFPAEVAAAAAVAAIVAVSFAVVVVAGVVLVVF